MKALILCPGPSLPNKVDRTGYDIVITVNRAFAVTDADYAVILDEPGFRAYMERGEFTYQPTLIYGQRAWNDPPPAGWPVAYLGDVFDLLPPEYNPWGFAH